MGYALLRAYMGETQFTSDARERIRKDIVNHRIESVTVGSGEDISQQEIDKLEQRLDQAEGEQLEREWGPVAEWLYSQGYDAQEQFDKLVEGEPVDYGYK
jgi:hypothetical protein